MKVQACSAVSCWVASHLIYYTCSWALIWQQCSKNQQILGIEKVNSYAVEQGSLLKSRRGLSQLQLKSVGSEGDGSGHSGCGNKVNDGQIFWIRQFHPSCCTQIRSNENTNTSEQEMPPTLLQLSPPCLVHKHHNPQGRMLRPYMCLYTLLYVMPGLIWGWKLSGTSLSSHNVHVVCQTPLDQ